MALFSLNYSYKVFEQVQGRIDRLNTPFINLYYHILRSTSPIDNHIYRAILAKKNFNERDVMTQDDFDREFVEITERIDSEVEYQHVFNDPPVYSNTPF